MDSSQHDDDEFVQQLVVDLNTLLENINISVSLEAPYDLTPSLLVALLECILQDRLPIPRTVRQARDEESKAHTMQIFLEVLHASIGAADLNEEEDLGDVDPSMLATGGWNEVVLVGDLLCKLARTHGLLPELSTARPGMLFSDMLSHTKPSSPAADDPQDSDSSFASFWAPTRKRRADKSQASGVGNIETQAPSEFAASTSTAVSSPAVSLSASTTRSSQAKGNSTTSVSPSSYVSPSHSDTPPGEAHRTAGSSRSTRAPRCIHEVEDLFQEHEHSIISDISPSHPLFCNCSSRSLNSSGGEKNAPVRRSGWIAPTDYEDELRSFEARRRDLTARTLPMRNSPTTSGMRRYAGLSFSTPDRHPGHGLSSTPGRVLTRHNSPTQHTLAMLNERAKLLEELANLKAENLRSR
ncbi:hypothetical protein BDW22DRAFT_1432207 [Trametopsis cervina]|nr:hypothetical protein BDW22DRAFT_1432207 [Trametopsis cervina]